MKRVWVDCETTGLKPREGARVVEVAAVDETGAVTFEALVNPGDGVMQNPNVDKALSINRISRNEIAKADPEEIVAARLREFIFKVLAGDGNGRLHSFNVWFDSEFLSLPPWGLGPIFWGECVMNSAMQSMIVARAPQLVRFDSGEYKWPKLAEAAEFFKIPNQGTAHRALTDAKTARAIHLKILASCGTRSTT